MSVKFRIFVIILTGLMWTNYPQTAEARTVAPYYTFVHHLNTCNMNTKEIWKDIVGHEGLYQVSNLGNVYSIKSKKILKPTIVEGYCQYGLFKNKIQEKKTGHRLVMISFVENVSNKETVNHINGKKSDNRLVNLEWATRSENCLHAFRTGLSKPSRANLGVFGKDNKNSIKVNQYHSDGRFIKTWDSMSDIERALSIKSSEVSQIANKLYGRNNSKGFTFRFFESHKECSNLDIIKTYKSIYKPRWISLPYSIKKYFNKSTKKVLKIDLNNNIVKKYNSVSEAANDIGGFTTNICSVCNGKMNTYKGFKWSYAGNGGYH